MATDPTQSAGRRCRFCRHFTPDDHSATGRGGCLRWARGYGVDAEDLQPDEVVVEDDEGWAASVGPDFGCVLWEFRPD